MRGGAISVADQLIINAVISFHYSGALVGFCVLRVDYCSYGLWHMQQCVQSHSIVIFVLHCIQWFCTIAVYLHLVFEFVCSVLVSIYLCWCTSLYPGVSLWNKGNKNFIFEFVFIFKKDLKIISSKMYLANCQNRMRQAQITATNAIK